MGRSLLKIHNIPVNPRPLSALEERINATPSVTICYSEGMIAIENATIHAGSFRLVGINLAVPTGSYGVLMGETGCGKTTLVETICGLRHVERGRISLAQRDITQLPPAHRNIGYVPQDAVLFPGMCVREHLTFPLKIRRWQKRDYDRRASELAELLAIGHLLDRETHDLSGGEKQRVAIGRALSWRPATLILDEPLSAVDETTRGQLHQVLKQFQRQTPATILHVTHNTTAADELADVRFVLRNGQIDSFSQSQRAEEVVVR